MPYQSLCVHSLPHPEVVWGLGRKTVLQLEQLRLSRVQLVTGHSKKELEMTSLQNLDCETQSVYFSQLPWCLNCGVEILC